MPAKTVIELKSITKQYDDIVAVDDVSIKVAQGDLMVLLGSSGCGKTTTLRLIAGLERPERGKIVIDNVLVASDNVWVSPEHRHIGMVFQDYALFPHLKCKDNISFALTSQKSKRNRVDEMLELVGMEGLGDRYPHQLSGGQQQRIALARALAPEPSVVLLDEPFSNLDAARRKQVREEVRQILKKAGTTGILVTHDQEEAMSIADTVAVMQGGRILQVGKPLDLYRYPKHVDVANFLGEANRLSGQAMGDTVQTILGDLPLAQPTRGRVETLIRPEALQLDRNGSSNGTVLGVRFHGHYQMVQLQLDDATQLEARVWAQADFTVDDRVSIHVDGAVVAFAVD
ncbi:MAG: ABC transporter ATP-binding protein [Chloroflexota bacterium]